MKLKNLLRLLCVSLIILCSASLTISRAPSKSEEELRRSIVRLNGPIGMCSGEKIRAPSGKTYILSAKHCGEVSEDGEFEVQVEDGHKYFRRTVDVDTHSDLLLLEDIEGIPALDIASSDHAKQHVKALTHGHDFDTYKSEGSLIQEVSMQLPPPEPGNSWLQATYYEEATSVSVVPGSSGGALLDESGELVGVASITDGNFGYFVRLSDIQNFLKDK